MAGFGTKTWVLHDDYMTPFSAWSNIEQYIPKDKQIWEPFYGNGQSIEHLRTLGCNVVGADEDFFENNKGEVIITNPPFSLLKTILERLVELDKPFIVIMPASKIFTQYFRKIFLNQHIQLIIPRKRIQFEKVVNGEKVESNSCNFDCYYYCWKMNLPRDIILIE
jgi:hypothetical protein